MKKEDIQERKQMYIARGMAMNHGFMDEQELYKELEAKFDKENGTILPS